MIFTVEGMSQVKSAIVAIRINIYRKKTICFNCLKFKQQQKKGPKIAMIFCCQNRQKENSQFNSSSVFFLFWQTLLHILDSKILLFYEFFCVWTTEAEI